MPWRRPPSSPAAQTPWVPPKSCASAAVLRAAAKRGHVDRAGEREPRGGKQRLRLQGAVVVPRGGQSPAPASLGPPQQPHRPFELGPSVARPGSASAMAAVAVAFCPAQSSAHPARRCPVELFSISPTTYSRLQTSSLVAPRLAFPSLSISGLSSSPGQPLQDSAARWLGFYALEANRRH